jgi:hypothetical protein
LISASFVIFLGIIKEKGSRFFCRMPIFCH